MNTRATRSTASTSWRRPAAASLAALAVVAIAVVVVGVAAALDQAAQPPTCYGIGFGCTPPPATAAALFGYIFGLPTVGVAWLVTWAGWALTRERPDAANRIAAWWPVWALTVATGVLTVWALTTAG